jgi:hypothetical protein
VDEISAALGDTSFVVIWAVGGTAADELSSDVATASALRESIDNFRDAGGKMPKAGSSLIVKD